MQNRLRSKPLWVAVFSLVIFILKTYFAIEIPKVDFLVESLLLIATLLGVFNNPTDKEKW
jgi:uncharacterized membrane protein